MAYQLRELEAHSLIIREAFPEVPPKVEYRLSVKGSSLVPILNLMAEWGEKNGKIKKFESISN